MRKRLLITAVLVAGLVPLSAQDADDPIQAMVEDERIRKIVETAFVDVMEARIEYQDDTAFVEAYTDIAYRLGNADPRVVPFLIAEAMLADTATFYLATYALALQGTPEAIQGLYDSIERAEGDDSSFAVERKAQLVWGLAVAGDLNALKIVSEGRHDASGSGAYRTVTTLEAAAMLTAPESVQILNKELMDIPFPLDNEARRVQLALQAVSRIGDPSSLPVLLRYLTSEHPLARLWAVYGLGYHSNETSVKALLGALRDEHTQVTTNAARSLSLLLPSESFEQIVEILPDVSDPATRGYLYATLAGIDPEAAFPVLSRFARGRPSKERRAICRAIRPLHTQGAMDLLIDQLGDSDLQVAGCALRAISERDSDRARRVLLRAIDSPHWYLAQQASKLGSDNRVEGAAQAILRRLMDRDFPRLFGGGAEKVHLDWLLEQLLPLGDTSAIEELETVPQDKLPPTTRTHLQNLLTSLRAAEGAGADRGKWEELAFNEDALLRRTAYDNVGHVLPAEVAANLLAQAFGRVELDEGERVIEKIAHIDSERSRDLVEQILTSPEYDRPDIYAVRDVAAWAARRFGGERMTAALEQSIEQRLARDFKPMVYYAVLRGKDALPLLERHLAPRLRFKEPFRGLEYEYLRRILLAIERGQSLGYTDHPPEKIKLI